MNLVHAIPFLDESQTFRIGSRGFSGDEELEEATCAGRAVILSRFPWRQHNGPPWIIRACFGVE